MPTAAPTTTTAAPTTAAPTTPTTAPTYFRNASNDFVDATGSTVTDPSIRLNIGQSVGGDISKLPVYQPSLANVKTSLNDFQTSQFQDPQDSNKRLASTYDDEIAQTQKDAADEATQFQTLRDSLNSQDNVSLENEYKTLSTDQGVPGINSDLATTKDAERTLETGLRTVSGDAGIEPESVFQADLAQKQQPLLLKEQTLTDRLNAAKDYITQALSLKETDQTNAASKLNQAITLVQDSIGATQNRLTNLNTLRSGVQDKINQGQSTAQATVNTLVSTGALSKLSDTDLHTLELEAGMPAGTLSSVAKSVQPKANVIATETDDNGNLAIVSQNPDGTYSTHVVPGVGKKTTTSTADTTKADTSKLATALDLQKDPKTGYVTPAQYKDALAAWTKAGNSADAFTKSFSNYINPVDPQDYDINEKAPTTKGFFSTIFSKIF